MNNTLAKIIKQYHNRVDWGIITLNPGFLPSMISKYSSYFNILSWRYLSANPNLTDDIIYMFFNKLDMDYLSMNPNLSLQFIEKYSNLLDWHKIVEYNANLTIEFIKKYISKININKDLSRNYNICIKVLEYFINHKVHGPKFDWILLSSRPDLPLWFIEKYKNKIDIPSIIGNENLVVEKIEEIIANFSNINWIQISTKSILTFEFIKKYRNKLYWPNLLYNPSIDLEIIFEILKDIDLCEYLHPVCLSLSPNIKYEYLEKTEHIHFPEISRNQFNYHPYLIKKYKKWYNNMLLIQLPIEIEFRNIKKQIKYYKNIYDCCIHEFKMHLRDKKYFDKYK